MGRKRPETVKLMSALVNCRDNTVASYTINNQELQMGKFGENSEIAGFCSATKRSTRNSAQGFNGIRSHTHYPDRNQSVEETLFVIF